MVLKLIVHGSPEYAQMIRLREEVLLQPIGVSFSYIQPQNETEDLLIGAFESDRLVGCCVLTRRSEAAVQLRQMAVDTALQGKGAGTAIIRYAEEVAAAHGYATLFMHARNDVIPFYEKCGYTVAGPEFFEVSIGHHRMEKRLL